MPVRNKKPHQLLLASVQINGEVATAMLDTGSNADIMSSEFARVCKLKLFKLAEPVNLRMACTGSRTKIYYGMHINIVVNGVSMTHYFDITNINSYNMILGIGFLRKIKVKLDFSGGPDEFTTHMNSRADGKATRIELQLTRLSKEKMMSPAHGRTKQSVSCD
jgi:hypothetical protein